MNVDDWANAIGAFTFAARCEGLASPASLGLRRSLRSPWSVGAAAYGIYILSAIVLFALAFLPMFAIGGLTGLPLGLAAADIHLHDTYYVIGHFHYVVAPGTIFALLAGIYYWFPKVTGRMMSEMLGKIGGTQSMRGAWGDLEAVRLDYTICKRDHVEEYTVYATRETPRYMLREDMPETPAINRMKQLAGQFTRGLQGGALFRTSIYHSHTVEEVLDRIEDAAYLDPRERAFFAGDRAGAPLFVVCTHGKHDPCCARYGRPLFEALSEQVGAESAWQCTHVGGDRFAANAVCLPHGVYYGRVERDDVEAAAQRVEARGLEVDPPVVVDGFEPDSTGIGRAQRVRPAVRPGEL